MGIIMTFSKAFGKVRRDDDFLITYVRNMDSKNWPYSRHENFMSGIWKVKTVDIPDINFWCLDHGQDWPYSGHHWYFLSIFWTSMSIFRTSMSIFRTSLSIFRTSFFFYCPYSGHRHPISGIWREKTVYIPNINDRNMDNDVRDMDNDIQNSEKIPVLIPDIKSLMSKIWTVKTGPIPEEKAECWVVGVLVCWWYI